MRTEISCGGVIYEKRGDKLYFVIIKSREGFYGFPKGHMESGETEIETAKREVKEEVGLDVEFVDGFREEIYHKLTKKKDLKKVVYFLAKYSGGTLKYQRRELSGAEFMAYEDALSVIVFENTREVLTKARDFILNSGLCEDSE